MEVSMKVSGVLGCAFFLLASGGLANAALAADNCNFVIDGLKAQYQAPQYVVVTGLCHWGTPAQADSAGQLSCVGVLGQGAVVVDKGHRTVVNWIPSLPALDWVSYLHYCAGYKGPAPDPAMVEGVKKEIEELRGKLKQ
jgi:hypothetical protein